MKSFPKWELKSTNSPCGLCPVALPWCLVRPHSPHNEHDNPSPPIFPASELDHLAFKALIPPCYLSCLEGLAQTVTLSFQFLCCRAKGRQRFVESPSHFPLGEHRYKASHKKPEGSELAFLFSFTQNFSNSLEWKYKSPALILNRNSQFLMKLGEKKKIFREMNIWNITYIWSQMTQTLDQFFSFFASPWMLPGCLLSVISVLKYAIITVFHCLMVSMHMSFSHSTENNSHSAL